MLTFNFNNIRTEKVYISKVTGSYVYVRRNLDDSRYEAPGAETIKHLNRAAARVPFPENFAQDFIRQNFIREFNRAKRACLVWYGDTLIHVEVERGRKPDTEGPWISHVEAALDELPKILPKDQAVHYDGQYLFWMSAESNGEDEVARLDPQGRFALAPCTCISMSNLGVRKNRRSGGSKQKRSSAQPSSPSDQPELRSGATVIRLQRSVLLFRPLLGKDRPITVVSPVLERNAMTQVGESSRFDDRRALYRMGQKDSPVHGSLEFVMKAADVIGSNYGHEAVDFLDLPTIIAATGEVNLNRIDPEERRAMPIQHRAEDCIAWLMGFIHRETDVVRQRKLTSMFRYVLRNGLVEQVDIDNLRLPGHADTDIPLKQFRGSSRLPVPAPF